MKAKRIFILASCLVAARAFATGPVVSSGPTVSALTPSSVTFTTQIGPGPNLATVYFNYGLTTNYGSVSAIGIPCAGPPGARAVVFNGTNQNGIAPGFGNYSPTNEITIEFWQYVNSAAEQSAFILNPEVPTNRINAHTPWIDDNIYWDFGNIGGAGRLVFSDANLIGSWNHIALVSSVSNNSMSIFVNGSAAGTASKVGSDAFIRNAADLLLGGGTSNNYYFGGQLADFRVWNQALSLSTIEAWMNVPVNSSHPAWNSLVAYWPMNEGSGTNLYDQSGNGHTATLNNGPVWTNLPQNLSVTISNLTPGMTYHFQMVATNSTGVTKGSDFTVFIPAFLNVTGSLPTVIQGTGVWADFNNDGKPDILTSGFLGGNAALEILQNLGNDTFSNLNFSPSPIIYAAAAVGDLFNDGDMDFVLTGDDTFKNPAAALWHNLGNGNFTNVPVGFAGAAFGDTVIGDFGNSGRNDVLIMGLSNSTPVIQLWQNLGNGVFTNLPVPFSGSVHFTAATAADFDGDGRLDLLLTGTVEATVQPVLQLWRNLGNYQFELETSGPIAISNAVAVIADFDNDGRPDIFLTGTPTGFLPGNVVQFWRNLGGFNFTNSFSTPDGPFYPMSAATGDFYNNGLTDVIVTGEDDYGYPSNPQIWKNLGNGVFTNADDSLNPIADGSVAVADFAGTGTLGFLLTGVDQNYQAATELYQNYTSVSNTPPAAPAGLTVLTGTTNIILTWDAASDAQTPSAALTYNVRIGTKPNGIDIVSPEADPISGTRRVPEPGNAGENLFALYNLPPGIYYWSVQAVDGAFTGSPFAPEEAFEVEAAVALPFFTSIVPQTGGKVVLTASGQPGANYTLQGSTNLSHWTNITTLAPGTNGFAQYTATNNSHSTQQFFRLAY